MYAGIPTKLRISAALLLGVAIVLAAPPGFSDSASAQEPVSPGPIDATEKIVDYDEKAAQSIDGMLMCPVCPSQTIDQSQVPIAKQMRQLVREKLSQGESRGQILEYFAGVYGADILAAPSKSGFNLLAWTVPLVGIFGALAAVFFVLRSMTVRRAGPAPDTTGRPGPQQDLTPYLQAVDQDLGITEFTEPKESQASSTETSRDEPGVNRSANG